MCVHVLALALVSCACYALGFRILKKTEEAISVPNRKNFMPNKQPLPWQPLPPAATSEICFYHLRSVFASQLQGSTVKCVQVIFWGDSHFFLLNFKSSLLWPPRIGTRQSEHGSLRRAISTMVHTTGRLHFGFVFIIFVVIIANVCAYILFARVGTSLPSCGSQMIQLRSSKLLASTTTEEPWQ